MVLKNISPLLSFGVKLHLHYRYPYRLLLLLVCLFACLSPQGYGQTNEALFQSNYRQKTIAIPTGDTVFIDSLSIASKTFSVNDISDSAYTLFPEHGYFVWKTKPVADSIALNYRVLPFSFTQKKSRKSTAVIDSNYAFTIFNYSPDASNQSGFVDFNSIDYNGSYGRSLSIGNSQDVALNSNFNLQLNGYILDSVRIEAAITDNNIPFQPDGNTQQIQEFDRLYITFEKGRHKLTAGDYNLERPNSYFINFNKRVQGIFYQGTIPANKKITNKVGVSASIAKGQFARNIFMGIEGNQGPYKLTGNNGEQFFIVLANTEKVYIDGVVLQRGEDRDYIINYNTGEITFMPRILVTKDKRIQVEFEYQDRNYLNSLIYAYDELQIGKKLNIRFNAYSNQDAKNQPYLQSFSGEQKRFLESIGDNIDEAYYQSLRVDTFAANKILYKIVDSTVAGIFYDSIFVYTTNKDSAQYSLNFSYVGEGKGNYIISGINTNGRSYSWIAPSGGAPQGNYEPVMLLVTPKKQQLFTLGTTYQIDSLKQISMELAASNYAPNLFSSRDKDLHWGASGRMMYTEQRFFGKKDSLERQHNSWSNQLSYEYVQGRFKAIAPFRNVEFARDWNVALDAAPADEQLVNYNTELRRNAVGNIKYNLTYYRRGAAYNANRNILSLNYDHKSLRGNLTFNLTQSKDPLQTGSYFRPSGFLERDFKQLNNITLGGRYELEHNELKSTVADTLVPAAFSFDVFSLYAKTPEAQPFSLAATYTVRSDKGISSNSFIRKNQGHTFDLKAAVNKWANHQISFTGAYRTLLVNDTTLSEEAAGESVVGRIEYNGNIGKGFLVPSILYEAGSGQEQKREYTYVEVAAGQGIYYWNVYNGDGVQQANEFELALFPDQKKFVRIITPTNEYVKVNYVTFNHSLQVNPESLFGGKAKKGFQKFISRFSDQLSVQITNRALSTSGFKVFNPFNSGIAEEMVIANLTAISNTFFFNRSSAKWGAEYTYGFNSGKSLLTYGLESNGQTRNTLKLRWNITKNLTINTQGQNGVRRYTSALDDGRTYDVSIYAIEPSITWILRSALRITGSYKYDERDNKFGVIEEKALIRSANIDTRISFPSSGSIQARGTYAVIGYSGADNTSLSFVMLDALQKGTNWLWYLNWERRISKGIEVSLEYEGRKPGTNPVIHTGRMSVRAVL